MEPAATQPLVAVDQRAGTSVKIVEPPLEATRTTAGGGGDDDVTEDKDRRTHRRCQSEPNDQQQQQPMEEKPGSPKSVKLTHLGHRHTVSGCSREDALLLDVEKLVVPPAPLKGPPWCRIAFAVTLCLLGVTFVCFGLLAILGVLTVGRMYGPIAPYGLIVFGILCLVPGTYHVVLALRVALGGAGVTWDELRGG